MKNFKLVPLLLLMACAENGMPAEPSSEILVGQYVSEPSVFVADEPEPVQITPEMIIESPVVVIPDPEIIELEQVEIMVEPVADPDPIQVEVVPEPISESVAAIEPEPSPDPVEMIAPVVAMLEPEPESLPQQLAEPEPVEIQIVESAIPEVVQPAIQLIEDTPEELGIVPVEPLQAQVILDTPVVTWHYTEVISWRMVAIGHPQEIKSYVGTLTWAPVEGAIGYTVEVDGVWVADKDVSWHEFTLVSEPSDGIRVTAWDSEGNESEAGLAEWLNIEVDL